MSFCNQEEKAFLKDIQKLINQQIPLIEEHPFPLDENEEVPLVQKPNKNQRKKAKRRAEHKPKEVDSANKPARRKFYAKKRS